MQRAELPAPFDPAAALATHIEAQATALDIVCTNRACTDATTGRELCECTECHGDGHGVETNRLMDAARAGRRRITATRGAFAGLPVPAADDTTPLKVADYHIHLDDDEIW